MIAAAGWPCAWSTSAQQRRYISRLITYGSPDTSTQVAGVVFNILDDDEIRRLEKNQAKIKILTAKLKRRDAFSDWNSGEMRALGSRQPSGGRAGDGYAPYPSTKVLNQEDIHTLFEHAAVCFHPSFVDLDVPEWLTVV
jgi:hypothetical protein